QLDEVELRQVVREKDQEFYKLEIEYSRLEKGKKAFVSLKRNEFVKEILEETFRERFNEFDALHIGPKDRRQNSGTSSYNSVNLQVYACSAHDCNKIGSKHNGRPTCFSDIDDTEIPRLRDMCVKLELQAQTTPVMYMFTTLEDLLRQLEIFAGNVEGVNVLDRLALGNQWESSTQDRELAFLQRDLSMTRSGHSFHNPNLLTPVEFSLEAIAQRARRIHPKQPSATRRGLAYQGRQAIKKVAQDCINHLRRELRGGLENLLRRGAAIAEAGAISIHDRFAPPMVHWSTYRA
ncbi:unnamed protein product, partial [Rhizoctonia solani]